MNKPEPNPPVSVQLIKITENHIDQRLDNFLISRLKGVPKSFIYRIVRKGEVRVNKGRVDVSYRLAIGDVVRIPPVRVSERPVSTFMPSALKNALVQDVLFEDDYLMVINKPAGFAVHGGSGINAGVIEGLRLIRPEAKSLELVHRLDKDTSGCLIIAKKRSALKQLHELFRLDRVDKTYLALLSGRWLRKQQVVDAPLQKYINQGGERMVVTSPSGKAAETLFRRIRRFKEVTLVEAMPKTGRTHQIRVHAASLGHPIVGDGRYGGDESNLHFKNKGYNRMFLHAARLTFQHPFSGDSITVTAPLPNSLTELLEHEESV